MRAAVALPRARGVVGKAVAQQLDQRVALVESVGGLTVVPHMNVELVPEFD